VPAAHTSGLPEHGLVLSALPIIESTIFAVPYWPTPQRSAQLPPGQAGPGRQARAPWPIHDESRQVTGCSSGAVTELVGRSGDDGVDRFLQRTRLTG
jgi:hypothetical protein